MISVSGKAVNPYHILTLIVLSVAAIVFPSESQATPNISLSRSANIGLSPSIIAWTEKELEMVSLLIIPLFSYGLIGKEIAEYISLALVNNIIKVYREASLMRLAVYINNPDALRICIVYTSHAVCDNSLISIE